MWAVRAVGPSWQNCLARRRSFGTRPPQSLRRQCKCSPEIRRYYTQRPAGTKIPRLIFSPSYQASASTCILKVPLTVRLCLDSALILNKMAAMNAQTIDTSVKTALEGAIEIVCAYASNPRSELQPDELQSLIRNTFFTLAGLSTGSEQADAIVEDLTKSKGEIRKSIGAEYLTSFVDGRDYKSLKRHLAKNGYAPDSYRQAFGLPADYPMTHPAYSARRSALAKSFGLGLRSGAVKEKARTKRSRSE